jgi:hypothetical protein
LKTLARPAGLEPATSWFVAVMLMIHLLRPLMMKIRRFNDLQSNGNRPSTAIDLGNRPSLEEVTSQFTSQHNLPSCSSTLTTYVVPGATMLNQ